MLTRMRSPHTLSPRHLFPFVLVLVPLALLALLLLVNPVTVAMGTSCTTIDAPMTIWDVCRLDLYSALPTLTRPIPCPFHPSP